MVKNHTVLPVAALYENQAMMLVCRLTGAETVFLTRAGGGITHSGVKGGQKIVAAATGSAV
jgi:hypothetical protein